VFIYMRADRSSLRELLIASVSRYIRASASSLREAQLTRSRAPNVGCVLIWPSVAEAAEQHEVVLRYSPFSQHATFPVPSPMDIGSFKGSSLIQKHRSCDHQQT
jgi:hypothetical protein